MIWFFVRAELAGPAARAVIHLALDTGATRTVIRRSLLVALGCDPSAATESVEATTASGVERAPLVTLEVVEALGVEKTNLRVLSLDFPPGTGIDGLLGLDFLRDSVLKLDFRLGKLTLEV